MRAPHLQTQVEFEPVFFTFSASYLSRISWILGEVGGFCVLDPALLAGVISAVRRYRYGGNFAGLSIDMMPPFSNIEGISGDVTFTKILKFAFSVLFVLLITLPNRRILPDDWDSSVFPVPESNNSHPFTLGRPGIDRRYIANKVLRALIKIYNSNAIVIDR